ncbi:hypothetical protein ACFYNL_36455 [Streptomyces sp. NPDC007808]|uniref:hypothetical protein n=1 Tax=Streptomyces sp. NPDC007808 TaxID=3364779 RepID=UPI0036CCB5A4
MRHRAETGHASGRERRLGGRGPLRHRPSFREAARVAEAPPPAQPLTRGRSFHELSDIGLRRLLYALRQETRIQEYTERRLSNVAPTALDVLRAR